MSFPNFFLIGAPRCGTTSLAGYLADHPKVLFSEPKEPKLFHTDFHRDHRLVDDLEDYLDMFGGRARMASYSRIGEGTVWYLFSDAAVPNILELAPDARFLVMVRDPVELAHSLHAHHLYGGDEDVEDFETAWRLQDARRHGERLPKFCRDAKALQYGPIAATGWQVERLLRRVPREQVRIGLFDELRRDPAAEYRATLEFLGLEDDRRSEFPVANANLRIHRALLTGLFRRAAAAKRSLGMYKSLGVWRLVSPRLSRHEKRKALRPGFRAELIEYFRADIEKLSGLLDRDLSHWTR
jgi:hypothetical protein